MANKRDFGVCLLGASGSVGHVMARYLTETVPSDTRWAIAGRADSKLRQSSDMTTTKTISRRTTSSVLNELPIDGNRPDVIFTDAKDLESLRAMAKRTSVVVTTVGPYVEYGEAVVRACVEEGTHYVDITGEAFWVTEMAAKYGEQARANGACIVSFAGYDCVPFELSTYLAHRTLSRKHDTPLVAAESLTAMGSFGPPRGTMLTCVGMPGLGLYHVNKNWLRFIPSTERVPFLRDVCLWCLPWWSAQASAFTLPEVMGAVACTIVHASSTKLGYPGLRYNSRYDVTSSIIAALGASEGGMTARIIACLNVFGLLPMLFMYALMVPLGAIGAVIVVPLILLPPTRALLLRLIASVPPYAGSNDGSVLVRTRARGANGAIVNAHVELPGDPGIYVTALCAAETALAVLDCAMETGCTNDVVHGAAGSLPVGFTTPLHACGDVLVERIKKAKGTVVRCE